MKLVGPAKPTSASKPAGASKPTSASRSAVASKTAAASNPKKRRRELGAEGQQEGAPTVTITTSENKTPKSESKGKRRKGDDSVKVGHINTCERPAHSSPTVYSAPIRPISETRHPSSTSVTPFEVRMTYDFEPDSFTEE